MAGLLSSSEPSPGVVVQQLSEMVNSRVHVFSSLFLLFVLLHFVTSAHDDDDYMGLTKSKFRTNKLNVIWEEASKHLKGQKLKSLLTELKAHEKAILNLKKKRHTVDKTGQDDESFKWTKSANLKAINEEVELEGDLELILSRYHLDSSLAHAHKSENFRRNKIAPEESDNHINSIHERGDDARRKYEEPQVELLHKEASSIATDLLKHFGSKSESYKGRLKDFEEWFLLLEQDLNILESRVKKQRWLEEESNRLKLQNEGMKNHRKEENHDGETTEDNEELEDVTKRLKSLRHKINKSNKELGDRVRTRREHEFATSRSEGDL